MPGLVCQKYIWHTNQLFHIFICLAYVRYTTWLYQAHLTNNKDLFLYIVRYHCRSGVVQQYEQMLEDLVDDQDVEARPFALDQAKIEN
jgi:hypothetical protein